MSEKKEECLRLNFKFSNLKLKKATKKRAKEEGRTLTAHINELCKTDTNTK